MNIRDRRVTACIPHFRCRKYIRRAVESLLVQTHENLLVVVVNDGDPEPPWDELAHIRDPRLIRFEVQQNRGPYFATEIVLSAARTPYFLIQDADDWSAPTRVSVLLDLLEREGSDLAVSAQPQYTESRGAHEILDIRWATATNDWAPDKEFVVRNMLTPDFDYRAPHHGLFRSKSICRVGGYYAGFRVAYDTLLTNLILMTGRISHVARPLYYRQVRPESLTHSPLTGFRSAHAQRVRNAIMTTYRHCYAWYSQYLSGRIDSGALGEAIRRSVMMNITAADAHQLSRETERLEHVLESRINRGLT